MSVITLLNNQINNVLNNNTKNVIGLISEKYNIPFNNLTDIWNNINPEFKVKPKKEHEKRFIFVEDDCEKKPNDTPKKKKLVIEDTPKKKKLEIEDSPKKKLVIEDTPKKKKLVIEDIPKKKLVIEE